MAITYTIDVAAQRVTMLFTSPTTYDEWEAGLRQVFADPDFRPGFDFLSDRRTANPPPTIDAVRRGVVFFELNRLQFGTCRWAMVVAGAAAYGMGRMGEALAAETGVRVRVFTDMAEAVDWLEQSRAERPR